MDLGEARQLIEHKEKLRVSRDHVVRAKEELEGALNLLGVHLIGQVFKVDARDVQINTMEVYEVVTKLAKIMNAAHAVAVEETKEAEVLVGKRGCRRDISGHIDIGMGRLVPVTPVPNLPKLQRPSQKDDVGGLFN